MVYEGRTRIKVGEIFHLGHDRIGSYVSAYEKLGLEGLLIKKAPRATTKLAWEQEQRLYDTISYCTPEQVGLGPLANRTALLACKWVEQEFSVSYKERGMRDMFYRLGLSYTRPTCVLKKSDPARQAGVETLFESIKN